MWAISYQTYASKWLIIPAVIACDSPIDLQYLGRDDAQRPFPTIIMTWGKPVIFFKSISIIFVLMRIRPADTSQVFRNISPTHSNGDFFLEQSYYLSNHPILLASLGQLGSSRCFHPIPCPASPRIPISWAAQRMEQNTRRELQIKTFILHCSGWNTGTRLLGGRCLSNHT